jgi:predicted dehydrogenase
MTTGNLHIGIAGAGSFANFAVQAFLKSPGINVVAVTDINNNAALQMANDFGLKNYNEFEKLIADENIHLIYIASPPFLHYSQSKLALHAGKHVICEKPASLKTSEAEELAALAKSLRLLYVVNLMQRYNPLYKKIETIIQEKNIGNFLHGFFENYASDEKLSADHWFWDKTKSGGIFIEHGVHFFDLFEGWFGEGKVASALQLKRANIKQEIIDRVQATIIYKNGNVNVNFYHGFNQPLILDRQEMRLQFEFGDITLYGWIPVKIKLHALLQKEQLKRLQEIIGQCTIINDKEFQAKNKKPTGRFSEIIFEDHITLESENISGKQNLYQQMLTDMITDQFNWIKDRNHLRVITSNNAVQSLKLAADAEMMAQNFNY